MKYILIFFALVLRAAAQQPELEETTIKQIRCELLVVRMPAAKAVGLQKELRNPKTTQQGLDKVLGLIEKNQAELVDWPTITTRSGNRAVVENVREIRYPIEYDVPQIQPKTPTPAESVTLPAPTAPPPGPSAAAQTAAPAPSPDGPAPRPKTPAPPGARVPTDEIASTPGGITTFETRNAGVTFEIEPQIGGDGRTIDVSLSPSHVNLLGHRREIYEVNNQLATAYEVPIFETFRASTSLALQSGQPYLLGFFNLREPKNTVELFILTLTVEEFQSKEPKFVLPPTPENPGVNPPPVIPGAGPLSPIPGTERLPPG